MMNTDGTQGGNNMNLGQIDDQQMITLNDRENYITRLTQLLNGNRDLAKHFDNQAIVKSGGKAILYKKTLQMLIQERNQQVQQQQQQQQQAMMNSQQQTMYMQQQQPQPPNMMPMQQQQQPQQPQIYQMQTSSGPPNGTMMNVKQEPQPPMPNMPMRQNSQNFPIPQQQQQIKQELMAPSMAQQQQQQQIKQELMAPPINQQQQQPPPGIGIQQMRQQPMQYQQPQQQNLPNQPMANTPQQRNIVQQLQQGRQPESVNPTNVPPTPAMNNGVPTPSSTNSGGSSDEILQQLLTSPNPPKQPTNVAQNAAQARLRNINRAIRNPTPQQQQQQQQPQQPSPMTPGSDPMMTGNIPSPHSHPGMMQQGQTPMGMPPGQSPLARYMMAQSPQTGVYRPQMSPMNMMNYANSPSPAMIDEEIHYFFKYFSERVHYLTRIMTRCQQEGQHDKVAKYRQLHDQMAVFVRNPMPEHLMAARRLKDHIDRILDPRMFGAVMMAPMVDMNGMVPPGINNGRLITNGIFEQCQRAIGDYLGKDNTLKFNVTKRFLEPLSEVLNGVPHKNMRLDTEFNESLENGSLNNTNTQSYSTLRNQIDSEFSHLSMNTFTYDLKPLSDKYSTIKTDKKDLSIRDYELTCRFIENNMPVVPPLKIKLTVKYPDEPPEVLSLTSTTLNSTPAKLENSDGHSFFEAISQNFIYFLFKLPAQHTITDILDIWQTAIRNASLTQTDS